MEILAAFAVLAFLAACYMYVQAMLGIGALIFVATRRRAWFDATTWCTIGVGVCVTFVCVMNIIVAFSRLMRIG
jgi:hypothetical protein